MWEMLKYLLASYPKFVTTDKLIEVILHDSDSGDPAKNVRDIIYRLRKMFLSRGLRQEYILFENGSYAWNTNAECFIDFVEFNRFLREARDPDKSDEERISSYNEAITLYQGDFMGEKKSHTERWASYYESYYRRLFLLSVASLSNLYEHLLDYENVILLHNRALLIEPYEESLYAKLIQILIKNGEYALAKREYQKMEKLFLREFDAPPSQTIQDLYDEAVKAGFRQPTALSKIKEQFDKSAEHDGPIYCASDTFSHIYKYGKRVDERKNFPVYLCKLTLLHDREIDLSKAKLEHAMKTMLRILLSNLRRGDIVCRYSPNQFLLMLTPVNVITLRQGIQRINSLFEHEPVSNEIQLETEVVPIKDVEE